MVIFKGTIIHKVFLIISGFWTPYHTFALVNFLGMIAAWIIRIDISVTIVAMVNQSNFYFNWFPVDQFYGCVFFYILDATQTTDTGSSSGTQCQASSDDSDPDVN